jgi:rhamnosyltransferase
MRSFNEGWALCQTLPAVQRQDWKNWELIVIDSGSTDGSVELIRQAISLGVDFEHGDTY